MKKAIAAVALAIAWSTASAALLTIDPITAAFGPTVGGTNVTTSGQNTASPSIRWGIAASAAGRSGYDFVAAAAPLQVNVNPPPFSAFSLGTFSHVNQPINAGTSISGTFLTITYGLDIDGTDFGLFNSVFAIRHNETPNAANPCADGGVNGVGVNVNGCADLVEFDLVEALSDVFRVGLIDYFLDVGGLTRDSGTVAQWWTTEGQVNVAGLQGSVRAVDGTVPEPGPLALMGLGLLGMGVASRRKRK